MSDPKLSSWLYPKPTGDPGRDRNARSLQFACFLLAGTIGLIAVLNTIERQTKETPLLVSAAALLAAAAVTNRAGMQTWAARTAFLGVLATAVVLVFEARDGFRSLAMLLFPALLLITIMMLDRASYATTAGIVLAVVAALGIAEMRGLTRAIPGVRSPTTGGSILFVDLYLLVIALIGSRIARDTQRNVEDLRASVDRAAAKNRELTESTEALRASEAKYRRLYESITDAVATADMNGRIVEFNPVYRDMLGYSDEELRQLTYEEITPRRWHSMEARIVADKILPNGYSGVYEKEYRRRDGSVFPVELRTYVLRNEEGQPSGMWAIVHDITDRKQDEQAIREGEERLRIAKDAAKLGIYEHNVEAGTVVWDARVRELWGVDQNALITINTFYVGLHPEDRAKTQVLLDQALDPAGNGEYYAEYRVISLADGSVRWVAATGQVFFEKGQAVRVVGTAHDISERKRTEAELRESEERFRNMADTAPVMIWVSDADKLFTFVNKTWLDFTGRTMEQELGTGWAASVHPDDLQRCYEIFSAAFDARRSFQLECRLRRADGEYRQILCSGVPRFAPGGIFAGYIGSDIDVTNLQSEERFRQLAENIDEVFWMLDLDAERVLYVSPAFERVWGRSAAPLFRDRGWLAETVHPEDRERVAAFFSKLKSGAAEETYRIVRPDGSVRWIYDRGFLVYDQEGKPYRVAGIAEDITAHRDLEEELRQAQKMEAAGRLAGGIAHDFNNLLTVVGGYLQLVLAATPPSDSRHDKLQQILKASNRASALTRQLLAFSRKQMVEPKVVNVNNLLTDMQGLLRPVMGEHIRLETDFANDLPCVRADPNQLEQVLMNLAANARDAMPEGGEFRIRTALADAPEDPGSGRGRCVRIQISDTGCGMSQNVLNHVFEPFFTTKGTGKGTGLGLSTVYGIIQQNHGTIHVTSSPGGGATFEILLPASPESEEPKPAASPDDSLRGTETILVAEDEEGVRELVCETLEHFGYTVLKASNGSDALSVFEAHGEIDALLTDVIMPMMGGTELAKRVRSVAPGIKVIYMSGYTDDTLAVHGLPQPGTAFIQKPFAPTALAEKLRQVLSSGGGRAN